MNLFRRRIYIKEVSKFADYWKNPWRQTLIPIFSTTWEHLFYLHIGACFPNNIPDVARDRGVYLHIWDRFSSTRLLCPIQQSELPLRSFPVVPMFYNKQLLILWQSNVTTACLTICTRVSPLHNHTKPLFHQLVICSCWPYRDWSLWFDRKHQTKECSTPNAPSFILTLLHILSCPKLSWV